MHRWDLLDIISVVYGCSRIYNMKLKDLQQQFHSTLDTIYGKEEVSSFFSILTEFYLGLQRHHLILNPDEIISENDHLLFQNALEELKKERPVQYIIQSTEFLGLPLKVNENVLIPRPETEELVQWISKEIAQLPKQELHILDIGTGSGCIAIALKKKFPKTHVYGIDISGEALQLAKENAKLNQADISFAVADILVQNELPFNHDLKFDIIVSNPPYVREMEKEQMQSNVLGNEPSLALFVSDEDPLIFYQAIRNFAVNNLSENGLLFFEINEYLGNAMRTLLMNGIFKDIIIKKDVFEKDRMVKAIKKQ